MKGFARFAARLAIWAGCLGMCVGIAAAQQAGPGGGKAAPAVPIPAPAAAPTAGAAAPTEPTVRATPAWWQIKGVHGTLYLLGSIHVMKPNVDWESPRLKATLDASDELYLEVANADDPAAALPLMLQFGTDPEHPLSTKLSKDDMTLLNATAGNMGLPLDLMQPWLVSVMLEMVPMLKDGYDPASGIDMKMLAQSKQEQKPVKGFETASDQLHMMADVPQAEQVAMLHEQLTELDKAAAEMNDLVTAWEHGDVEKIARIDNGELATKHPAEYKRLVVDRNVRWAATLDGLLKAPGTGTVFVVVGAGHLAGPDSVLKMLEKDGYKVVRE